MTKYYPYPKPHGNYPYWAYEFRQTMFTDMPFFEVARTWADVFHRKTQRVSDWDGLYHELMESILEISLPYDEIPEKYDDDGLCKNGLCQSVIDLHKNWRTNTEDDWKAVKEIILTDVYRPINKIVYDFCDKEIDYKKVESIIQNSKKHFGERYQYKWRSHDWKVDYCMEIYTRFIYILDCRYPDPEIPNPHGIMPSKLMSCLENPTTI